MQKRASSDALMDARPALVSRMGCRATAGLVRGALLLAVLVAAGAGPDVAKAQPAQGRGPWCVVMSGQGGWLDCSYYSLEQCLATASGVSNSCTRNSWYVEPEPRMRRYHPRRRHPAHD